MAKVRIEAGGHIVEVDDPKLGARAAANLAAGVWGATRRPEPMQVGFGSQLVERTHDRPVHGNGAYEIKPGPVTS